MVNRPVHARWCPEHERYYRGAGCPLCQHGSLSRIPPLEREKPAAQRRGQPRVAVRQGYRPGDPLVTPDRARIQAARVARGWSRQELARRADVHAGHVQSIEGGSLGRITLQTAQRLAAALDTTVAALTIDERSP